MTRVNPLHNSHTHCQSALAELTNQNLSKSVSEPMHGGQPKRTILEREPRKPNKMYNVSVFEILSPVSAI